MVYRFFVLLLFIFPSLLTAQLEDDFSDGNFSANPTWMGDINSFIVNSNAQLQLSAAAAGTSQLYTAVDLPDSLTWEIYLLLDFAPSGSNQVRIYLQADQTDLLNAQGYFIEVGESGSGDALKVYRQDGAGMPVEQLAAATAGQMGSAPAVARIRVSRTNNGNWTLEADYSGGNNFQTEATFSDATYGAGNAFFGLYCKYTSSRTEQFFFDDLSIQRISPDTVAPILTDLQIIDELLIDLSFNEALDPLSAEQVSAYSINNSIGQPNSASLDLGDPTLVHLELATPLISGQDYTLTANPIRDLAGNLSEVQQRNFSFFQAETALPFDLLITEIMADPTPVLGLPATEYFEIFNNSDKFIELADLQFSRGGNQPIPLEPQIIAPGAYLIVCDESDVPLLSPFGTTAAVPNFPALTNSGDIIRIELLNGSLIHQVDYDIDWYQDSQKEDGGWSLELISPQQLCSAMSNWRASNDPSGGTPGRVNSIFESISDNDGPVLLRAFPASDNRLRLFFDEALDPANASDLVHYQIPGLTITNAIPEAPNYTSLLLETAEVFEQGTIYELSLERSLSDCLGNLSQDIQTLSFGLPEEIMEGDIVLNEILYFPEVGGDRFVELYNRSDKILNAGELFLGSRDELGIIDDNEIVPQDYLLFPNSFVVLSSSASDINMRYTVEQPDAIIEMSIPSYDNKADIVLIYTTDPNGSLVIDELSYTSDFHNPLLDDERGVSIERINPEADTQAESNWHSAAQSAGFATPTYQNSQFMLGNGTSSFFLIDIPNPRLSPDGDGFEDFLQINYQPNLTDYTANIRIFDTEGRLIKSLVNNELLAAQGQFIWEGDTDEGNKARIGIYILFIELFTPNGEVHQFKETCVLAGQLD